MSAIDYNTATLDEAIEAALFAAMIGKRHCLPGRIVSFNSKLQTVVVEPMVSAENEDGSMRPLPPAADVPLFQLGGGDFVITLEPKKGDPCLLLVADRCIDVWYELAENAIPGDFRQNDLSDCFCLVGFRPKPLKITNWMEGVTIRKVDGSHFININNAGKVSIKAIAVDLLDTPTLNAPNTEAKFKEVNIGGVKMSKHRHQENGDGGGITNGPQN